MRQTNDRRVSGDGFSPATKLRRLGSVQARGPFAACVLFIAAWLAILWLGATWVSAAETRGDALLAFGARIAGDDARSRVVIDFDGKPSFSVHYLAAP